jgi:hypothetical protein
MTPNTTTDFKLPSPMRTRVLLPQPEANTMPKPNMAPPTSSDNHGTRPAAYRVSSARSKPSHTKA